MYLTSICSLKTPNQVDFQRFINGIVNGIMNWKLRYTSHEINPARRKEIGEKMLESFYHYIEKL